jgi:hypothetical protein
VSRIATSKGWALHALRISSLIFGRLSQHGRAGARSTVGCADGRVLVLPSATCLELGPVRMMQHRRIRYIGLDVHKATIAMAIAGRSRRAEQLWHDRQRSRRSAQAHYASGWQECRTADGLRGGADGLCVASATDENRDRSASSLRRRSSQSGQATKSRLIDGMPSDPRISA